ncbi:hypothetical protein ACFY5H_34480 [Streptomyces sp. NPDC013012]|uniref:hypothetical protein n=1 Tax=Streptomyces sp. NPDC013012 TaxID=3364860 RepID=UPI0036A68C1B
MTNTTTTRTFPEVLRLTDAGVREELEALPDSLFLLGHEADSQAVTVGLDADSPYVLVVNSTGDGTTTALRTLAAQLLHHGAHTCLLDSKRISHTWARTLPAVTHRADPADIHDVLLEVRAEMGRRIGHLHRHGCHGEDLPRLAVLIDAGHHLLHQLACHWDTTRRHDDLKTSPAVDALHELLFAGPEVRIHVLFGAQPNPHGLGPQWRENFSTIVLGRVTARTWTRLAPHINDVPKTSSHPGCDHAVQGISARPVQVLYLTHTEAAAQALTGTVMENDAS